MKGFVYLAMVVVLFAALLVSHQLLQARPNAKVLLCHVPPGNPANAHVIEVADSAIPAHLAHGDCIIFVDGGTFNPGDPCSCQAGGGCLPPGE